MDSKATPLSGESQPTVRVMRLYKPNMPLTNSTLPPLVKSIDGVPFIINPNFLLPDSFGEIFVGETFSAFIAVVGNESIYYKVNISVKLQTLNDTIDLTNISQQANSINVLNINNFLDIVVHHRLTESTSHTLRVIVDYINNKNENKVLKKFYRFNVIEPLSIICTNIKEYRYQYCIQFKIVNLTKLPLSIEKVRLIYDTHVLQIHI